MPDPNALNVAPPMLPMGNPQFPTLPMAAPVMPRFSPFNDAITGRLAELYKAAMPSFMGLDPSQRKAEYSFVYNNGGAPGIVGSSHTQGMHDNIAVYPNTAGIVHSHPISSVAYPSGPDIDIARQVKRPNYVLSQNALWMADPSGQVQQIANIQYKDGQMTLLPASGKNALLHKP